MEHRSAQWYVVLFGVSDRQGVNLALDRVQKQDHHTDFRRERTNGVLLPRALHFLCRHAPRLAVRPTRPPCPSSNQRHYPHRFQRALEHQPKHALLPAPLDTLVPLALFAAGQTFVITSTYALGITGTFLGDYFGILMDHRVEGFPFNVLRDPMYVGSTLSFAAVSLWYESPAGLLLTAYVYVVYVIALRFEGYVLARFSLCVY